MLRIQNAGALAGYSGEDHNVSEDGVQAIIGRSYRSVREALHEVARHCSGPRGGAYPYVWAELTGADGVTRRFSSV